MVDIAAYNAVRNEIEQADGSRRRAERARTDETIEGERTERERTDERAEKLPRLPAVYQLISERNASTFGGPIPTEWRDHQGTQVYLRHLNDYCSMWECTAASCCFFT